MEDTDLSSAMLTRIRNHVLVSLLGFAIGIAVIVSGRVLGGVIFGAAIPGWWVGLSFVTGALLIPVIGIGSAFRILRCPGCNGLVGFQVSGQASLFASRYGPGCRHCGKKIFDGRFTRRMRIVQVIVFFGTLLFFFGMAALRGH